MRKPARFFQDHFSGHADRYEAYRPTYPTDLFAYLAALTPYRDVAWDCATGNGQAAIALAAFFRAVVATDASERQVAQARLYDKVRYLVAAAEKAPIADTSIDLVTVAQALHWLDLPKFYAEVKRVSRPGGILAVWCYQLNTITPEVDAVIHRLYHDVLGPYWLPERRLVEAGYRTLPFPFEEMAVPAFRMVQTWDLAHVVGYLGTWSSSRRYHLRTGHDAIDMVRRELEAAWGEPDHQREVVWPLHLRVGRA